MKAALERLGFGPCNHGLEALRRSTDGEHWLAAYEAGGGIDWSVIFDGYRATLDWPTVYFRRTVPADLLLVYRVQEGWEPLCRSSESTNRTNRSRA